MTEIENLIKEKKYVELEKVLEKCRFQPYAERNFHFITSSKLKAFDRCQLSYKYKYIDLLPDNTEEPDYFIVGTAFDDLVTYGVDEWKNKYETVSRRKDDATKIQLTNTMAREILQMFDEYKENKLFHHNPQKKVMFYEFAGFCLKIEMDSFDGKTIVDYKSTANLLTFNPSDYVLQAAFYQWIVEEVTGDKLPVRLNVLDKYKDFSRSEVWEYRGDTLSEGRGRILGLLEEMRSAHDTGIFKASSDKKVLYSSPYYGFEGYGRQDDINFY